MNALRRGPFRALPLVVAAMILLLALAGCDDEIIGIFVTMKDPGTTADGVEYGKEDILMALEDGGEWFKIFDGSEFGLTPKHNIAAFSFNELLWYNLFTEPPADPVDFSPVPELYLTFTQSQIAVPGVPGLVRGQDIVKFTEEMAPTTGGEFEFDLFFDGSDVGLSTISEKIDGLGVWPPNYFDFWIDQDIDIPYDCSAGVIFVTTQGNYRVPAAGGGSLVGKGSDILLFCAFNTGADTTGLWYRVYNGVTEGIRPYQAGYSLDVLGFELFDVTEQATDLDAAVLFMFTPRTEFTSPGLDDPGLPSEVFIAGTGGYIEGPIVDFNDAFAPVNGVVDGISLFDMPFYEPAP